MGLFKRKKTTPDNIRPNKRRFPFPIGLALSGGGARGFAHIGAIKAFEEENIVFDYVAGTSAGSIVGAVYCAGFSSDQMTEFALTLRDTDIRKKALPLFFPSPARLIGQAADKILGGITFDQLQIPFCAVAVDLRTGEEIWLTEGKVSDAVSASCAAPVVFSPAVIGDMILVDGGLLNTIPADVCRSMGAETVISVDLNSARGQGTTSTKLTSVMAATWRIVMKSTAFKGTMNSDLTVEPNLTMYKSTTTKQDNMKMIQDGYEATKARMPEILQLLLGKK